MHTLCGVPQGSVLGLVLFLINKLTLNIKKSNFVLFHPYQKKLDYIPNLKIFGHKSGTQISLESKTFVKYLGILLDSNLSWKAHIDYISLKISKQLVL